MIRIIPRLDIKGPNLVKGIHLEGLRVLGDPKEYANFYYQAGADELIFQDVVASLYQRNSLNSIIEKTAQDIFIPLTVSSFPSISTLIFLSCKFFKNVFFIIVTLSDSPKISSNLLINCDNPPFKI